MYSAPRDLLFVMIVDRDVDKVGVRVITMVIPVK